MVAIDPATMPVPVPVTVASNSNKTTKKKYSQSTNLLTAMATKLHWTSTPSRAFPHGLTGMMVVLLGGYLTVCAINGDLGPYGLGPNKDYYSYTYPQNYVIKYVLYLFLLVSFINSASGFILAPKAITMAKPIFRRASVTVLCLVYFAMRFLPECYIHFHARQPTLLRMLDIVFGILIVGVIMSFLIVAYIMYPESKAISLAAATGSLGISTFSALPIHLLVFGNEWLECVVQTQYPLQGVAMTAYVYVPSITVFSLCIFLATLYLRKMITDVQLGASISLLVVFIVVWSAVSMELIIPYVSSQKFYLPCIVPTPETNPIEYYIMNSLDASKMIRQFFTGYLGRPIPPPMYTEL